MSTDTTPHEDAGRPSDYARALGARLRGVRQQQGLSLHAVEERSERRWKAVVVGSYERGDRAISVQKLAELASFYGVPVADLLPSGDTNVRSEAPRRLVLDLDALSQVPSDRAGPLTRYVAAIQTQRGDFSGRALAIRMDDLRTLAVIYDVSPQALVEDLIGWGVFDEEVRINFE
jgi:transcriptional regulator with XRE-family HTH domain